MERLVNPAAAIAWPPLRQDLRLHESGPDRDGAPTWAIQDPVANRFYRIGWFEYECLLRWPEAPEKIAADIAAHTPLQADAGQVEDFIRFLEQHQLLAFSAAGRERLLQQLRQPGWKHWRWWLHHYLFIRVPLVRPERFLARLAPLAGPLLSPLALFLLLALSLTGFVLVARQWETFTHGVLDILTPGGLVGFLLALTVSKTLHELGHALVATRLGVRVAHMGIAFIVLWPMLYTDTGESWRLRSHRQRLAISVAGIGVELALAGLATLAWALLDDGALRQAALYLATTGWVVSLALNASPFMRFDGYFILSDLIDFPNLHERSGALARVWLRRRLLGLADDWPESLPVPTRRALIAFACITWLYRLVVFLGIAWAVYAFFFKALGIFLMGVEVVWFIARPVWSELALWKRRWREVAGDRRRRLRWLGALLVTLLVLPWRFEVEAPGVAHTERQQFVYAPFPAMLETLHPPAQVAAGTVLATFVTPDLAAREQRALAAVTALEHRLAGLLETKGGMTQQRAMVERLGEQFAEARSAREEALRLRIAAEFDGVWLDVDPELRPGVWTGARRPLGVLVDPSAWVVDAYVGQREVGRLAPGAPASFKPEGSPWRIAAEVVAIDTTRAQRLVHDMLDSRHGGHITTQAGTQPGTAVPTEALYRVRLRLAKPLVPGRTVRGQARIAGERRSLAWESVKGLAAVLIRESGF